MNLIDKHSIDVIKGETLIGFADITLPYFHNFEILFTFSISFKSSVSLH